MRTSLAAGLAALLPFATATVALGAGPLTPTDVSRPEGPASHLNLSTVERFWFSGQPDADDLKAASEAGVELVITLRAPAEFDWDERAEVQALGMEYRSVPISGEEPFSAETFTRVDRVLDEFPGKKVLVHCASSNRVGAWFATHLVRERGMSIEDALAVGSAAGMTKDSLVERVRVHLSETPIATVRPQR